MKGADGRERDRLALASEAVGSIDAAINALSLLRRGVQQADVGPDALREFLGKMPKLQTAIGALAVNSLPKDPRGA